MSLTFNTKTFNADAFGTNKVGYIGPAKTAASKDDLSLSRVPAKPVSNFSGVNRLETKLTRTMTLTGALTPAHDAIVNVTFNVPVGTSDAAVDALCADMSALIATADFKTHIKSLKINY